MRLIAPVAMALTLSCVGVDAATEQPFDEMRPNPYFQPPDAKAGAPIDVSDVGGIAFAPQDTAAGRVTIGRFVVTQ